MAPHEAEIQVKKLSPYCFEIPQTFRKGMRVHGIVFADDSLIKKAQEDKALEQVVNVAFLPGIIKASLAMPDIHWGYGFPIGGVAATDLKEGVISPGGVGFDISCLVGNTEVLHEHGYRKKIKDFGHTFESNRLVCMNFAHAVKDAEIQFFLKKKTKDVYKIETQAGHSICATADHPFYTPEGMKQLGEIKAGDKVAIYPFEGAQYEKPSKDIIASEEDILALPHSKNFRQTIDELKQRNLLPLRANNPKLPYLLKLIGFVMGDGTIYFNKNKGTIWFWGEPRDLKDIQKDIERLGFRASRIYSRVRSHKIDTFYGLSQFSREEYSIKTTASSLVALLWAMGMPLGNKTLQNYEVPAWLFNCPLWQKRLFLAALFGAELSSPSTVTGRNCNFYGPVLSMNKEERFIDSGERFLVQIRELLLSFGVGSSLINKRREYVNRKGETSFRLRLQISSQPANLVKLWSLIGFEYNYRKRYRASAAIQYLKLKQKVIDERENAISKAVNLKEKLGPSEIYRQTTSLYVNRRFIERSLYEGRKTHPRVPANFPSFDHFFEESTRDLGSTGMVWDTVESKTSKPFDEYVYDFTVNDEHHNFVANNFIVSNCGVRLLRTSLMVKEVAPVLKDLMYELARNIPKGVGSRGKIKADRSEMRELMVKGAKWAVNKGYGWDEDLRFMEEEGCVPGADPGKVSDKAFKRGADQSGTLGAGNHFLELQEVVEVYDPKVAEALGLYQGQLTAMIHSGSRGVGHQICTDYIKVMDRVTRELNIELPDRQLACAPIESEEGKDYYKAMACAVNYALTNRHCLAHWVRESFQNVFRKSAESLGMSLIYDVSHNIAKFEEHEINGEKKRVCVHRKGATRAFGPNHPALPEAYKEIGQPVIIPGDMGTCSYVLVGTEEAMKSSFGSTCHGAGRLMSRTKAKKMIRGDRLKQELESKGIMVLAGHMALLAEEAPQAYKDVSEVVDICHGAGLSRKVVKLKPIGVLKG